MIALIFRATVILTIAFLACWLLRRAPASYRVWTIRLSLLSLLALPLPILFHVGFEFVNPIKPEASPILLLANEHAAAASAAEPSLWWAWLYLAGVAALLARFAFGVVILSRVSRRAHEASQALAKEAEIAVRMNGVFRDVEVRVADIGSPMTYGCARPVILVPPGFMQWSRGERDAVLLHEAAHIKGFDCGWQRLGLLTRAIYWCHPLVWPLSRALKDEAELAADERAISAGIEASDYAAALLEVARKPQLRRGLVRSLGVTFMNNQQLDRRVRSALRKRRGFASLGMLGVAASSVLFAGTATISFVDPKPEIVFAEITADIEEFFDFEPMWILDSYDLVIADDQAETEARNAAGQKPPSQKAQPEVKVRSKPVKVTTTVSPVTPQVRTAPVPSKPLSVRVPIAPRVQTAPIAAVRMPSVAEPQGAWSVAPRTTIAVPVPSVAAPRGAWRVAPISPRTAVTAPVPLKGQKNREPIAPDPSGIRGDGNAPKVQGFELKVDAPSPQEVLSIARVHYLAQRELAAANRTLGRAALPDLPILGRLVETRAGKSKIEISVGGRTIRIEVPAGKEVKVHITPEGKVIIDEKKP